MKKEVTTDTAEIQRIMDKFLEKHNLLRLNHEEIKNLNILITSKDVETVIKNLPPKKAQDHMDLLENSTKHSKNI